MAVTQPGTQAWKQLLSIPEAMNDAPGMQSAQQNGGVATRRLRQAQDAAKESSTNRASAAHFLSQYRAMTDPNCPLFARKFSASGADAVAKMAKGDFASDQRKQS